MVLIAALNRYLFVCECVCKPTTWGFLRDKDRTDRQQLQKILKVGCYFWNTHTRVNFIKILNKRGKEFQFIKLKGSHQLYMKVFSRINFTHAPQELLYIDNHFWGLPMCLAAPVIGSEDSEMNESKHCVWSRRFNTLATWCEEPTHWKRPWCWERLKAGGQGGNRGWDGWMASQSQRTWVWASSGR